ncbi:major capsid protein (plasmid) [Microbulbifer sp. ANSA001]|uniref:major capsid protein n=1 Tax=Microbulbifer sp. ANSA001 TaxID=3243358 RepID=UPI0040427876
MEIINILENDAFSRASMSEAINTVATQPKELKDSGLFTPEPIRTGLIAIECRDGGALKISPLDRRGDPHSSTEHEEREMVYFETRRVAKHDRIMASDLGFVTQFGNNEQLIVEELQKEVARRLSGPGGLQDQNENRLELMRLSAIKGDLRDHEGNLVYNFYDKFNIAMPPVIKLGIASKTQGDLRKAIESQITRPMRRKARGRFIPRVECWSGEEAWDTLMANDEFRKRYETAADKVEASKTSEATLGLSVPFGGVVFKEYFGADDGTSINLEPTEMKFIPGKGAGLMKHVLSPGEGLKSLGTQGQEWYSYLVNDKERPDDPRWIDLYLEQFPMIINTAPDLTFHASSAA